MGTAVRDGAIAAYFQEPTQLQPRLHFYDTHNTQLGALWEQALTDNIDITVGPLLKPNVEAFRKLTAQSVQPRLLLNFTNDGQTISGEYQIGIAIEEEARAIIDSLLFSGFSRLLVVESEARWANRVLLQLQKLWPHKIAHAQFSDIRTITQAVGQAMAVSASQQRHTQLQQIIGEQLEFLPRARKDVDAIVTLTNQVETQALIPALKFHFADSLPVYATSQAARGAQTPQLDGIRLTEMPMFAQPSPSQQSLDQAFELNTHPQAELLGLGFDAAKLALHLAMHVEGQSLVIPGARTALVGPTKPGKA